MASMLLKASRKEQHSDIRFLWPEWSSANANHTDMHPVYGDKMSYKTNNACLV